MASSISFSGAQKVLATSELSYGERPSRSSPEVRNSPPIKLPHSRTSTDATRLSMAPPYLETHTRDQLFLETLCIGCSTTSHSTPRLESPWRASGVRRHLSHRLPGSRFPCTF